ncbi:hypothetical protein HPB52_004023 [Rhipicephalus sanguineus]|uniref:Uncharacterized protein n=1 Tax=Rhipicephalus sanguineus TaxID=34632 RepID=A0A9D4PJ68_RHISA|nr:hypothetical protein HPB52_004023 [Rhipicephalus sanguineus]
MVDVVTTIPNTPVDGPEPVPETFVPTAVWIVLSFVGTASDCFIGALPYFDAQCCLSTHAGIVTVAAALVTCGIYSADSLVNKIFGPNLPAQKIEEALAQQTTDATDAWRTTVTTVQGGAGATSAVRRQASLLQG